MVELTGTEPEDFVICRVTVDGEECGGRFLWISNTHLKYKHHMSCVQYREEFPDAPLTSLTERKKKSISHKRRYAFRHFMNLTRNMLLPFCECGCGERVKNPGRKYIWGHGGRGRPGWAKGHTKYTHPGIARTAVKKTGRTKENDPGVAAQSAAVTGRTKETHPYIAAQSAKKTGRTKEEYPHLARAGEKHTALWQDPDWVEKRVGDWGPVSIHHMELKLLIMVLLEAAGWTVILEKWCMVGNNRYRVDIYATHDGRKIVVEVGGCDPIKLSNLRILYNDDNVFHVPYTDPETKSYSLEQIFTRIGKALHMGGED